MSRQKEWIARPEFNWCFHCWFNAKIETREIEIGTMILCLYCGNHFTLYSDKKDHPEMPRHFTDEEWYREWKSKYAEPEAVK